MDAALAAGGKDNVTCLLATVVEGPEGAGSGPDAPEPEAVLVGAAREPAHVVTDGGEVSDLGVSLA